MVQTLTLESKNIKKFAVDLGTDVAIAALLCHVLRLSSMIGKSPQFELAVD
jgi:hypothetical protein